jgi:isopentenyldiphosphate isomerase
MAEFIDNVDEMDKIIGRATRKETHDSGEWHRGVNVLLLNSKERLFLPMRSSTKDKFPNT